jgi:hypothetical protein
MIVQVLSSKGNQDGTVAVKLAKGADRHMLLSEALRLVEQYAPIIRVIDSILAPHGINAALQDNTGGLFEPIEEKEETA